MFKKYLQAITSLLFWLAPILFWLFWQLMMLDPRDFFILLIIAVIILPFVAFETVGRKFNRFFFLVMADLAIFVAAVYFFSSLLKMGWGLQFLWFYYIWHLYRYLLAARNYYANKNSEFQYFTIYHTLINLFLISAIIFGFRSSLSLSIWPLLLSSLPLIFINTISLALNQKWLKLQSWSFWIFISILMVEVIMLLSFLPLNFLVLAVLSTLFYYSTINFIRLYFENRLSSRKIKNYAIFTIIALILIFLTARWL